MTAEAFMRRLFSLMILLVVTVLRLDAAPMTDGERQRLLAHLDLTESWLVSEVSDLSEEQLRFRRASDTWNIMDVVEHLAIAEPQYWKHLQDSAKQPETTEKPEATDAGILWYGIDRSDRQKTGEARVPKGRWNNIKDSLGEFRKLRATMRDYANTTSDGLRSRRLIDGNMDVYQWFLMISTHSQRHILQIREIKADPHFPGKSKTGATASTSDR
jgi:DinB superfamily